ncbi:hypothetical protein TWF730_010571 [Orbilia blumenaviensis]|uniref:Uncharacterized protein n=1 Tax=Orbilia blumenaviensis TaxID=1796055 RepID=A0AAV9UNK6_9PEZI
MQLTNLLLPILSLTSVLSASPIQVLEPRADTPANVFKISNFSNSGVPHSLLSYVSFTVEGSNWSSYCTASSSVKPSIATTPFPTKCNKPGISFGFEVKTGIGYVLTIIHRYNKDQSINLGTIWAGTDVQTRVNPANPNGNVEYLNYPSNFTIPYSTYTQPKKAT